MSMESWKAEFYRVEAWETKPHNAARHSLQKWLGLIPQNLCAHFCRAYGTTVESATGNKFFFTSENCSLCFHFNIEDAPDYEKTSCHPELYGTKHNCSTCTLAIVRGGVPCVSRRDDERVSPWCEAVGGNPKPMIMWLRSAVELEIANE